MFHKVTIIGNLGSDPEMRYLPSGDGVSNFSVATNRKWTNSDGSKGEETVWWRVSAWGKLGEVCQQYLAKGRQVFIEGTMQPDRENGGPRIWTDQQGQPRASFEIRASTIQFLGGRDDGDYGSNDAGYGQQQGQSQSRQPQRNAPQRQQQQAGGARRSTMSAPQAPVDDFDDDYSPDEIPF